VNAAIKIQFLRSRIYSANHVIKEFLTLRQRSVPCSSETENMPI